MGLESVTYISDLVATKPVSADPKSEGDDHIRNIKSAIKTTFPNISGAVTVTHSDLNTVTAKAPIASPTFTGTPAAPTAAVGTSTTQIATTAFVAATSFSSALPGQASADEGDILITDGVSVASWGKFPGFLYQAEGII